MLNRIFSPMAARETLGRSILASCADGRHRRGPSGQINGLVVGLALSNRSNHPVAYDVIGLDIALEGCWGRDLHDMVRHGLLQPSQMMTVAECLVPTGPLAPGQTVAGTFQAAFRVGPPGGLATSMAALRTTNFAVMFKAGAASETPTFRWSVI